MGNSYSRNPPSIQEPSALRNTIKKRNPFARPKGLIPDGEGTNLYHVKACMGWLCKAQDVTRDGGCSAGYHLFRGWYPSYPETIGYIIETFHDARRVFNDEAYAQRAVRMADWLLAVQNPDGSVPGGQLGDTMGRLVFDTGQVLFGFLRSHQETLSEEYLSAALRVGQWLLEIQEPDGSWKRHTYHETPHAYHSRVAWALLELHRLTGESRFLEGGQKNIRWCLRQQRRNGWFRLAGFTEKGHEKPFTHTLAYTVRGILEAGIYLEEKAYTEAARRTADVLLALLEETGSLYGQYSQDWEPSSRYACLTGSAQISLIFLRLFETTRNTRYLSGATRLNRVLKRTQFLKAEDANRFGALAGSLPIWGRYLRFFYPNWGAKFFVDALLLEERLRG